ncbi:unnamed protein product [Owenia fusiformis]|uniref:Transcription initiation factor TFIID subunit 4 n=1 Tax=Owenia fusiformis TaxID=6347 RepID=A0A8S4NHN2_OWEFU|nr:unnamed protein product [Owenia fusiformis]
MANGNPLEEYLSSDVDESVINALVGSLESQLASPTSKEQPRQKSQLNALPNHIKSELNSIQNQHTSEAGQKTGLNLQNQNHSNSNTVGTVKTQVPNTQIIGINSVGPGSPSLGVGKAPTPKIIVNSSGVVQRSTSSNPISTSVSQQVISVINNTNAQNVVQQVINSAQRNIANHKNTAASGMAQDNPSAMYGLAAVAAEQKPMMVPKSETLTPQAVASLAHNPNVSIQNSHQSPSAQFVIKSETNNSAVPIKVEPTGRVTPQQTVVNIVSTRSSTPVSTGAIVNTFTPSPQTVTIVRTQAPANSQQIVVNTGRSQQKTIAPRMVTAQQQHRMVSSGPVRIASSPQQIIAPRLPGNPVSFLWRIVECLVASNSHTCTIFLNCFYTYNLVPCTASLCLLEKYIIMMFIFYF